MILYFYHFQSLQDILRQEYVAKFYKFFKYLVSDWSDLHKDWEIKHQDY